VGKLSESILAATRIAGGGERPQVEGSDGRWRPTGRERPQVEGSLSDRRQWRGAIAGGGEQSQEEGPGSDPVQSGHPLVRLF
jgi:hypothetical protein